MYTTKKFTIADLKAKNAICPGTIVDGCTINRSVVSMPRVTTLSVHYDDKLHCYKVAIEANNGNGYLGKIKCDSMSLLSNFLAYEIRILESTELEKGGDQNCM